MRWLHVQFNSQFLQMEGEDWEESLKKVTLHLAFLRFGWSYAL